MGKQELINFLGDVMMQRREFFFLYEIFKQPSYEQQYKAKSFIFLQNVYNNLIPLDAERWIWKLDCKK